MENTLSISALSSVRKTERVEQTFRPFGSDFYRDLFAMYGQPLTTDAMEIGRFSTFEGLCIDAIEKLGGRAAIEGVDLLVLAHYLPNTIAYHSTTSFLLERYGLNAFAFAVSDQERGASFTALDVARDYFATGGATKALLITVEQSTLPMPVAWPAPGTVTDSAVAMVLEAGALTSPTIVRTGTSAAADAAGLANALLDTSGVSAEKTAWLLSDGLKPLFPSVRSRTTAADSAVSAFWLGMEEWLKEDNGETHLLALGESCGRARGFLVRKPQQPEARD